MKLIDFRARNFRSVNDSGPINVGDRTALVGRNESGKTNLLLALHSLKTSKSIEALNPVKDFPRERKLGECSNDTPVVTTTWTLTSEDQADVSKIWPRSAGAKSVTIGRNYAAARWVQFNGAKALKFDPKAVASHAAKLNSCPNAEIQKTVATLPSADDPSGWAPAAATAVKTIRRIAEASKVELNGGETALAEIESAATAIIRDEEQHAAARKWAVERMPVFMYLDDYPDLNGHMDIQALVTRRSQNRHESGDENFMKLLKVAGLELEEIHRLLTQDHEKRQQLANRAGAVITKKLREIWKDRPLKVRFNLDGQHFDTMISDPNATYDVEVNLNERSRGLQWFFAFYINFAADTDGGPAENAVLLLDEPGMYLHAVAQRDLLNHFAKDFRNQIVYTTHSPFMVPVDDLGSVRTVNIRQDDGTVVSNEPTGDTSTLFPLQAALGYGVAQTLFIGKKYLLVEGVTDFWYINAVAEYLRDLGKPSLPDDAVVTPCGGAGKVTYMVSLLSSNKLPVTVLLDADQQARVVRQELVKAKLIEDKAIILVSEVLGDSSQEADIEDLLEPAVYEALVREAYAKELKGKTLKLNDRIPRIVHRCQEAFKGIGLEFHKTRPANLFLRRAGEKPEAVMTQETVKRFEALLTAVRSRLAK
jgi:energy-coupling factor transporter ATP-binding protein EcfA2